MQTIAQLFEEVKTSEKLQNELAVVLEKKEKAALEDFLKKNGCEVSDEEARRFFEEAAADMKETDQLTPEELAQVTGGSEIAVGIVATITLTQTIVYPLLLEFWDD